MADDKKASADTLPPHESAFGCTGRR